jgi:hypothetical protein
MLVEPLRAGASLVGEAMGGDERRKMTSQKLGFQKKKVMDGRELRNLSPLAGTSAAYVRRPSLLGKKWAHRITEAQLLTPVTRKEILTEPTPIYPGYQDELKTGAAEERRAHARKLLQCTVPGGAETAIVEILPEVAFSVLRTTLQMECLAAALDLDDGLWCLNHEITQTNDVTTLFKRSGDDDHFELGYGRGPRRGEIVHDL